jgi:triosephosphate isomerase
MTRPVWIGTSWKMTKTIAESLDFVREVAGAPVPPGVQPFLLPAHTSLAAVRDAMPADSPILLGAQNAHWAAEGAGTGEVSMRMVADAGAVLVEMGHSERRESFGETDETVARKAKAALDAGLTPLVCVGEPIAVRAAGDAEAFVSLQVRAALSMLGAEQATRVLVAYEPIWAIGTAGRPATLGEVAPVMAEIVRTVEQVSAGAGCRALLYGGSVSPDNADELLGEENTDGLFVGRAAWQPSGFLRLLEMAAEHAHRRG